MSSSHLQSYRHYKGGTYTLLHIGRFSEDRDVDAAVYVSHQTRQIWVRPLSMFAEYVTWPDGSIRPRFVPLETAPVGLQYEERNDV